MTANGSVLDFKVTVPLLGEGVTPFFRSPPEERWSEPRSVSNDLTVEFSLTALERFDQLLSRIEDHPDDFSKDPAWINLREEADALQILQYQTHLLVTEHLREKWKSEGVIPYRHQIETTQKVLHEMGGRAILADEVGLGKTIEAGMIVKELILRGMARKILILTPAGLVWQWHQEMKDKFNLIFGMQRSEYDWERTDRLIASIDRAKREPHRSIITQNQYDVLVIDEAHKLKNEKTQSYRLVNSIRRTYTLLLTATPVQNDLKELYNLIHLIRPGQLGTYREFKKGFMIDRRVPKQTDELKHRLESVLIRNRRAEGDILLPERKIHPVPIRLSDPERQLYDRLTQLVRTGPSLALLTLQREVCSSPIAAALTIEKMMMKDKSDHDVNALQEILDLALSIKPTSKVAALIELLKTIDENHLIVFTEYRATQQLLMSSLVKGGIPVFPFDGSMSASRKQWMKELFRRRGGVLVSTESGGEGLNFQFCSHIVNYDLPWNPMRLEQRIGRVHRLGQTREVHIFNMATEQTIEEHILYLLHEKINMFEMAIGELDAIITSLRLGTSVETEITRILSENASGEEVRAQLDRLADMIVHARSSSAKDEEAVFVAQEPDPFATDADPVTQKTDPEPALKIDTVSANRLRHLFEQYFSLIGAPMEACSHGTYRVELNPTQRNELEGRALNPWADPSDGALLTYYFRFDPDTAGEDRRDPPAELITAGCRRLSQVIESIRRQSEVTTAWVPVSQIGLTGPRDATLHRDPPGQRYRPIYVLSCQIQPRPKHRPGRSMRIAVDLINGHTFTPVPHLAHWPLKPGHPRDGLPVDEASISLNDAFLIAFEEAMATITDDDLLWAKDERMAVQAEVDHLNKYYAQMDKEGHAMDDEKKRRLLETQALWPKMTITLTAIDLLYLPSSVVPNLRQRF